MELMIVKDVMRTKSGKMILTGPLLFDVAPLLSKNVSLKNEVERRFGASVRVSSINGEQVLVPVEAISVSQGMSGAWQVSIGIGCPSELHGVALESLVINEQ